MCAFGWRPLLMGPAVSYVVMTVVFPYQAIAADWKERLLYEAPPMWAALEQYYAQMEASSRSIVTEVPTTMEQPKHIIRYDIRKNGEWMVYTLRRAGKYPDGKPMDELRVKGINSRYAFSLLKTAPDAKTFILSNFERASDENRQQIHAPADALFGNVFRVCYSNCVPLVQLIKDPEVTIRGVHEVKRSGREMAQLDYDCTIGIRDQPSATVHGTVLLDPEHYWCVREDHSDTPGSKIDGLLEYGAYVDGFPILKRIQHTTTYKNGTGKVVATIEFDKIVHRDIPESEFTLTAFGLPEVTVPSEQNPRTLWRWLMGIGVGLGVGAILLRRYAKGKRQAPHQA